METEINDSLAQVQRHIKAGELEVARKICKKLLLNHPNNKVVDELYQKLMLESKFLERKRRFTTKVVQGMLEEKNAKFKDFGVLGKNPSGNFESKKNNLDQKVELIQNTPVMNVVEIEMFLHIMDKYFSEDRPRYFAEYEKVLTPRFAEVIKRIQFKDLTRVAHNYLQFAKTVRPAEQVTDERQKQLSKEVLEPFLHRLKILQKNDPLPELRYQRNPNNVLFITRHAVTQSMYAPGKQIYAMAQALLNAGKNVQVISFGQIDEPFKNLMEKNKRFSVRQKNSNLDELALFHELRQEIKDFSPNGIFTEIEVSILVALEVFKISSPIYLVSAGFYRILWHSGIFLTEELAKMVENTEGNCKIYNIPSVHLKETLAPYCDPSSLAEAKEQLNISDKFVVASFGRYEKFSNEFLLMTRAILESIPNSVLILAGSNEQKFAHNILRDFIIKGRVKLLGASNISILGYCCDVFIDTFPQTTGFAALESMAKGKPVFSLDCESLEFYRVNRVDRLIFKSKEALIRTLAKAERNREFYNDISVESSNFIENKYYDLDKLSKAIIKVIN